jgi:hypothetical protein
MDGVEFDEMFAGTSGSSAWRYMKAHMREIAGSTPAAGSVKVGAWNGKGSRVYAVSERDKKFSTPLVQSILATSGQSLYNALRIREPPHVSVCTPRYEEGGMKFLIRLKPNTSVYDLYTSTERTYESRGWKRAKGTNVVYKRLKADSCLPHKYWQERLSKRVSGAKHSECPCVPCRVARLGPQCGYKATDEFKIHISTLLPAGRDLEGFQPKEGALIFVEYTGEVLCAPNRAHGNARDQSKGQNRTFPSTRDSAYKGRRDEGVPPNVFSGRADSHRDPRQKFSSKSAARNATRGAANQSTKKAPGLSDIEVLLQRMLDEDKYESLGSNLKGFVRSLRSVFSTGDDTIVSMWTPDSITELQALVAGGGAFKLGASPVQCDPQYGGDGWMSMQIVATRIQYVEQPTFIGATYFFKRQTSSTFDYIMKDLISVAPLLANAQWVNTDGCARLGAAIAKAFPKAHRGCDGRHVMMNILQHAISMGLSKDIWLPKIHRALYGDEGRGIPGILMQTSRGDAAALYEQTFQNWPPKLREYLNINKAETLLSVLSVAGRIEAGRVDPSGKAHEPETQSAESVHAQMNRLMGGKHKPILELVDGAKAQFDIQSWLGWNARMGLKTHLNLTERYVHLSLEYMRKEFELAGDDEEFDLPSVHLVSMIGVDDQVGAVPNTLDRSRPPRQPRDAGTGAREDQKGGEKSEVEADSDEEVDDFCVGRDITTCTKLLASYPKLYSLIAAKFTCQDEFIATLSKALTIRQSVSRTQAGGFVVPSTSFQSSSKNGSGPHMNSLLSKTKEHGSVVALVCGSNFCKMKSSQISLCPHNLACVLKHGSGPINVWSALLASYKKRISVDGEKASRTNSRPSDDDLNQGVGGATAKQRKSKVSAKCGPGRDSKPDIPKSARPKQKIPKSQPHTAPVPPLSELQKRRAKLLEDMQALEEEERSELAEKAKKDDAEKGSGRSSEDSGHSGKSGQNKKPVEGTSKKKGKRKSTDADGEGMGPETSPKKHKAPIKKKSAKKRAHATVPGLYMERPSNRTGENAAKCGKCGKYLNAAQISLRAVRWDFYTNPSTNAKSKKVAQAASYCLLRKGASKMSLMCITASLGADQELRDDLLEDEDSLTEVEAAMLLELQQTRNGSSRAQKGKKRSNSDGGAAPAEKKKKAKATEPDLQTVMQCTSTEPRKCGKWRVVDASTAGSPETFLCSDAGVECDSQCDECERIMCICAKYCEICGKLWNKCECEDN